MSSNRYFPTGFKIAISTFVGAFMLALAIIIMVAPHAALAAGGDLDLTLNSGSGFEGGAVHTVVVQPDGNILVGGAFTTYRGVAANGIVRLKPDGERDTTFTGAVSGGGASVRSIAIQADGKIIIGGDFTTAVATARNGIARLTTTGTVDTTFAPTNGGISGIANGNRVEVVAVAYDNKIYAGGVFTQANGAFVTSNIARYTTTGGLDNTNFATGNGVVTGTNAIVYAIEPLGDKRVLIGGNFTNYKGNTLNSSRMALIAENGTPDTTFNPTGVVTTVFSIKPAEVGKFVIAGGTNAKVAKIDLTGTLDNGFDPGAGGDDNVFSVAVQFDGKVILGGQFQNFSNQPAKRIVRLLPNGGVDSGFAVNTGADGAVNEVALQADGKIIAVGAFQNFGGTLARGIIRLLPAPGTLNLELNTYSVREGNSVNITVNRTGGSDNAVVARLGITDLTTTPDDYSGLLSLIGKRDPGFAPSPDFTRSIVSLKSLPDGDILAAGSFYRIDASGRDFLQRFNPNGSTDPILTNITLGPVTPVQADLSVATPLPDGKILVGGSFTTINGVTRNRIARLNEDATVDATFSTTASANGDVYDIVVQPDGKILIAGSFTTINGVAKNRIARLNSDGTTDGTFIPAGNGPGGVVRSIALQPDGKIVIGGDFTAYSSRNRLVRLNRDGTVDTTFVLATVGGSAGPNAQVDQILVQPDGKVVAVGSFDNYEAHYVQRFNSDGSLDGTFNNNVKLNSPENPVKSVAVQPDGKVIIGGDFTIFSDISGDPPVQVAARRGIARLNADGSLDNGFDPGLGTTPVGAETDTSVYALLMQPDGKILAGGNFGGYNGQIVPPFLRIYGDLFVSWAAGEIGGKTVTFTPVDDTLLEGTEQLKLTLDNLAGGVTAGAIANATVNILDNDVTVALVSSANPGQYGRTVFTATVTPITATGTVSFTTDTGVLLGTVPLSNGQAVITPANLTVGTYTITATYLGDVNFAGGVATLNQAIIMATPLITVTSSPNPSNFQASATFTVTVDPLGATGLVTVTHGATVIGGGPLVGGILTFDYPNLPSGSNVISATYEGDGNVLPGVSGNYTHVVSCPLVVSANTDDGSGTVCGTLSFALKQAATSNSPVTITLGAALQLTGPLPTVTPTVAVVLDGGCTAGTPGAAITAGVSAGSTGITLTNNMTLRGVKLTGFSGTAVKLTGNNNTLTCNWIGTTNGTTTDANSTGVGLEISGSDNLLGINGSPTSGNVIRSKGKNALKVLPGAKRNWLFYNKVATT